MLAGAQSARAIIETLQGVLPAERGRQDSHSEMVDVPAPSILRAASTLHAGGAKGGMASYAALESIKKSRL